MADTSNNAIRRITLTSVNNGGTVTTIAGPLPSGAPGFLPALSGFRDGVGTNALFNNPDEVATDPAGNVYVGDTSNHAVRRILMPAGKVETIVGGGGFVAKSGWADGVGTNVLLNGLSGVSVDQYCILRELGRLRLALALPFFPALTLLFSPTLLAPPGTTGSTWRTAATLLSGARPCATSSRRATTSGTTWP